MIIFILILIVAFLVLRLFVSSSGTLIKMSKKMFLKKKKYPTNLHRAELFFLVDPHFQPDSYAEKII